MLSFSQLQKELAFEVQHRYTNKIFECSSPVELITPTKAFIAEIAALVIPDILVEFRPKDMPP